MAEDLEIVNDLPANYDDTIADRIDVNFQTYFLQEKGNSIVNVEKWSVRKKDYIPSILGRPRGRPHVNQYLIKEDSQTDIGGGRMTFLKHFAQMPEPWFDYEQKSVKYYQGSTFSGINYDSRYGRYGFPYSAYAVRNVPFLVKATRYYVTTFTMFLYLQSRYTLSSQFSTGNWLYPDGLADNIYLNDSYTQTKYPARLFVNAPRTSIGSADSTPVVVAPDKITLWKPSIYEITRYESKINLQIEEEGSAGIPIIFRWIFDSGVTETSTVYDNGTVRVDLGNTFTSSRGARLNFLYFQKRLRTDAERLAFQSFQVKVQSDTGLKVVNTLLSGGIYENSLEESADQTFKVKWDESSAQINITFVIG